MRTFKNLFNVFVFVLIAFSAQTAFAGNVVDIKCNRLKELSEVQL